MSFKRNTPGFIMNSGVSFAAFRRFVKDSKQKIYPKQNKIKERRVPTTK